MLKNFQEISQFEIDSTRFYTKLRPHTQKFLEKMSKIYEMSIVTYGHRIYAHSIARILDPTETYFGQRIISRNELLDSDNKTRNIKFIFPKSEDLIVMIDDRPDVWLHSDALICVR
jgi:RNA polymerase II subunit A-like phosphatase